MSLKMLHFQTKMQEEYKKEACRACLFLPFCLRQFKLNTFSFALWVHLNSVIWKDKVFLCHFFFLLKAGAHSFHLVCWALPKIQTKQNKTHASFTVLHFNTLCSSVSWLSIASFQKLSITPFACKQSVDMCCSLVQL